MAAQPTPPQTPTTTSPTLTAAQARALLQTLLSTVPNATTPRTTSSTTTPNNASKPSSPPSKNQTPSSHPTITIDASTRIMGHLNTIHLPPNNLLKADTIEEMVRAALSHTTTNGNTKPTSQPAKPVNITIQMGINLMGSRNVVVFGSGSGSGSDAATKDLVKAQGARGVMETVCEKGKGRLEVGETGMGRKRRAESEPVVESWGKKVKVEKGWDGTK